MGQIRTIEKRGILILEQAEREARNLTIVCNLLQKPANENINYKYSPYKSFFGQVSYLNKGYVFDTKQLNYINQQLWYSSREGAQLAELVLCGVVDIKDMLADISLRVTVPKIFVLLPNQPVEWDRTQLTELRFSLEDGVVIQVSTLSRPMTKCTAYNVGSNGDPPTPPPPTSPPREPPKGNSPPSTGVPGSGAPLEISPPYNPLTNDGGNTYVPPVGEPGDYTEPGFLYTVNIQLTINDGGVPGAVSVNAYNHLPGKIGGLGTPNPSNSDADYGFYYNNGSSFRPVIKNYQRYGYGGRTNGFLVKILSIVKE